MTDIDALIAPRALTALEIASVIAPDAVIYMTAHRAFIHATVLQDAEGDLGGEGAIRFTAEQALSGITNRAIESLSEWLSDMEREEPRFYRKGSVAGAVGIMLGRAAAEGMKVESEADFISLLADVNDRTDKALEMMVGQSSDPK